MFCFVSQLLTRSGDLVIHCQAKFCGNNTFSKKVKYFMTVLNIGSPLATWCTMASTTSFYNIRIFIIHFVTHSTQQSVCLTQLFFCNRKSMPRKNVIIKIVLISLGEKIAKSLHAILLQTLKF